MKLQIFSAVRCGFSCPHSSTESHNNHSFHWLNLEPWAAYILTKCLKL